MIVLYLASFIGGLLLGVGIMIYGVERPREEHPAGERSFRLSPALFVAFGIVFGVVGYVLTRSAVGTSLSRFLIASVAGVIVAAVTARLVTKWWTVTPEHDVDDERYVLQGHLAHVTVAIGPEGEGQVAFEIGGERRTMRARGVDASALATGTEVVIERIEEDLAYVEAWQEVEKRL